MPQNFYKKYINSLSPIDDLSNLPNYAFLFFIRNIHPFKAIFIILTIVRISSTLLHFVGVYILGRVISEMKTLSIADIFYYYIPIWILSLVLSEFLDYFIRKYAETLPQIYADYSNLRFYQNYLQIRSSEFMNYSKEKLLKLTSSYVQHLKSFVNDWVWSLTGKLTRFVLVLIILYYQSPSVLLINLFYIAIFLSLAFKISTRFSPIAKASSEQAIATDTITSSFILNLSALKRLQATNFFKETTSKLVLRNWDKITAVHSFHAWRWLIQLNIFNALYAGTLIYGIYQVKQGELELGFLILIKWAFDELWLILAYAIEYYVSIVQQKEDALIIKREVRKLLGSNTSSKNSKQLILSSFDELILEEIKIKYTSLDANFEVNSKNTQNIVDIRIPKLIIKAGDKLALIGPSGSGKTSILNVLQNMIAYEGRYSINSIPLDQSQELDSIFTVINNVDPLFKISLKDNILLGREISEERLQLILDACLINEFTDNYEAIVGSADFNLSAGQEQRIRLARGLISNKPVILLDEAFNGIDESNKQKIIDFLKEFLAEKTVVLVSHNSSELRLVKQVYRIEGQVLHRDIN